MITDSTHALEKIVESLEMPNEVTVQKIGGAFDGSEIKRHVSHAPAVLIACTGMSNFVRRGTSAWAVSAEFAAYILTRDTPGEKRDAIASRLVTIAIRAIARSHWGDPSSFGVSEMDSVEATNLYGGDIDSIAVALWAVTWRQPIFLNYE